VRLRRLLLQCTCIGADPSRTWWIHDLLQVACHITNSLEVVAIK
jgi:hypothetical protein